MGAEGQKMAVDYPAVVEASKGFPPNIRGIYKRYMQLFDDKKGAGKAGSYAYQLMTMGQITDCQDAF